MIPDSQSIMLPYLKLLADSKEWNFQDLIETLAHTFKVSNDERQEMIPSGQYTFNYRVGFSRTFLKKAGLVESTRLGHVRITQKGLSILNKNPDFIDISYLSKLINSTTLRLPKETEVNYNYNLPKHNKEMLNHAFQEKNFEDIVSKYPELIEEGLILIGRQLTLYGRRMDLLFEDKFKRKLIIELKRGPIKDDHIGQVLSYEGTLLSAEDPTIRVMLVGNRVPPNIQRSLDHHGIAWKEITFTHLKGFLLDKKDESFLNLLGYEEPITINKLHKGYQELQVQKNKVIPKSASFKAEDIVENMKSSEEYKSLKSILSMKINNEARAKAILEDNLGRLNKEHIKEIITLVDEPYPYSSRDGKINHGPWFGRLLKSNTVYILNEDLVKINNWFNILYDNNYPVEKRIRLLLNEPYNIKGLNVGFISLMLYVLDKTNYLIWFQGQHEGLKIIYPELEKFTGSSTQYITFNNVAKEFAKQYGFEHTELDWVFTTGLYLNSSMTIYEQIKEILKDKIGSIVSSSQVKGWLYVKYNINASSIILSDYCYNRINFGIKFNKHIFEYIDRDTYKYLGENYPFTGLIFSKPLGEDKELVVGEWKNGFKFLNEIPQVLVGLDQSKNTIEQIFNN